MTADPAPPTVTTQVEDPRLRPIYDGETVDVAIATRIGTLEIEKARVESSLGIMRQRLAEALLEAEDLRSQRALLVAELAATRGDTPAEQPTAEVVQIDKKPPAKSTAKTKEQRA
jgi:hypothetical protein